MPSITLKDIPTEVHRALKQRARQHGRSLNKEALACLESAVQPKVLDVQALLESYRKHRDSLPGRLDKELLSEARSSGRP